METTDNVQSMFTMDKDRFLENLERLDNLAVPAGDLKDGLNRPAALGSAGLRTLGIGIVVILAGAIAVGAGALESSNRTLFSVLIALAFVGGIQMLVEGARRRKAAQEVRAEADALMRDLEGDSGFLWRFETMLVDWDGDLPPEVSATLPAICKGSREADLDVTHYGLRAYWYWTAALHDRMRAAKRVMGW